MKPNDILRASIKSDYQTAVDLAGASRNYSPSRDPLQQTLRVARFPWTATGSLVNGDKVTLGSLGLAGVRIIPELCRIRGTGTGTPAVKFTLEKTNAAGGSAVSLSDQTGQVTSPTATTALPFTAISGDAPVLAPTDLLKLVLGSSTTLTLAATNTFVVEVAYTLE